MSTQHQHETPAEELSEQQVGDFLKQNPDFFVANANLLSNLKIPHNCGSAISLIEHQVGTLQQQNRQYKEKLLELVDVARDNDRLNEKVQRLTLSLLDETDQNEFLATLDTRLTEDFKIDACSLLVWDSNDEFELGYPERERPLSGIPKALSIYLKQKEPTCGTLTKNALHILFENKDSIRTAAVIPMDLDDKKGLLALGSHDEHRFQSAMGKMFLQYLGKLTGKLLRS